MWFASLIFLYLSFVINLKLMKKIKILSLFVCLIALLAACEDEDITPSYGARTVLVYIAGNNRRNERHGGDNKQPVGLFCWL